MRALLQHTRLLRKIRASVPSVRFIGRVCAYDKRRILSCNGSDDYTASARRKIKPYTNYLEKENCYEKAL